MSLLIAVKRDDAIYFGTDTRLIVNGHKRTELSVCNRKIQILRNGLLLGITGGRVDRQTIFAHSKLFTLDKTGGLTRRHIVEEIIPALRAMLKECDLLFGEGEEFPYMRVEILLAHQGVLYEIDSTFCVLRHSSYRAVGDAAGFVQATLSRCDDSQDVNECILRALKIARRYSVCVGAPFFLVNTKDKVYRLEEGV